MTNKYMATFNRQVVLLACFLCFGMFLPTTSMAYMRDPTKPVVVTVTQTSKGKAIPFNLQSILIGRMRRLAMINDKLVGVGSTVNGARVLAIDKNHVVLLYAGRKKTLYLFGRKLWTTR